MMMSPRPGKPSPSTSLILATDLVSSSAGAGSMEKVVGSSPGLPFGGDSGVGVSSPSGSETGSPSGSVPASDVSVTVKGLPGSVGSPNGLPMSSTAVPVASAVFSTAPASISAGCRTYVAVTELSVAP